MIIAITGSTGLIGSAVVAEVIAAGHRVVRLVRRRPGARGHRAREHDAPESDPGAAGNSTSGGGAARDAANVVTEALWDPESGEVDIAALDGVEGVVHLAGENIAARRWSAAQKERIRRSRVTGTRLLVEALSRLSTPPRVLVSASATGLYGDRGSVALDEASAPGHGFLPDLCRDWEAEAMAGERCGMRVALLRIGPVLAPRGGALAKMLPIFRLGLGGRLADGRFYMPWIALDDLVAIVRRAVEDESFRGAFNAVAPEAVTNAEFTKCLGRVLSRPTMLMVPAFALRLMFGELADALLMSQRVVPRRLQDVSFSFEHPRLEAALTAVLGASLGAAPLG